MCRCQGESGIGDRILLQRLAGAKRASDTTGWLRQGGRLVSSDYVLDETLTLIRVRLGLAASRKWWEQVEQSSRLHWEWLTPLRAEKARHWFSHWKDKEFSFTDCTSFVIMRELRLTTALTVDRHFHLAGFQVVPKRSNDE